MEIHEGENISLYDVHFECFFYTVPCWAIAPVENQSDADRSVGFQVSPVIAFNITKPNEELFTMFTGNSPYARRNSISMAEHPNRLIEEGRNGRCSAIRFTLKWRIELIFESTE